jgi:tetratricopeptide (TPR) repeat protein
LRGLLAEVTARVESGTLLDSGFDESLRALESAVKRREHEELAKPIGRDNFTVRLRQIRRAFKLAEFTEHLREGGLNLYRFVRSVNMRQKPEYFKACTLVYELHDNLNVDEDINNWAAEDGGKVYARLRDRKGAADRMLLRDQVLWCTCYANEVKRRLNNDEALRVFEALYGFTEEEVMTKAMPCYGTRAFLSYHLTSAYRRKEEHRLAEASYMRAIEFYFERSRLRQGDREEFVFSTRRVAMCIGLGIGWVNLTRGYLRRAENALTTARSLMVHIPDPVGRYYIEMLWGTIRRCQAGSDPAKLAQAIEALSKAHEVFHGRNPRYEALACKELALAYGRAGKYEEAEHYLSCLDDYSQGSRDDKPGSLNYKLRTDAHVIRSRHRRAQHDYDGALAEAEEAYAAAKSGGDLLPLVDALMARGEAKLRLAGAGRGQFACSDAVKDFEAALTKLKPWRDPSTGVEKTLNDKIAAVCLLRIVQCRVRNLEWREANEYLERSRGLRSRVEHQWVDDLAKRVEAEFKDMTKDFSVSSSNPDEWKLEERSKELRRWLVNQALVREGSREKAGKLLGISGARVGQILREISESDRAPENDKAPDTTSGDKGK